MGAIFTVDWEDWNDALHIPKNGHSSSESWWWLICRLLDHKVKAVFYGLDYLREDEDYAEFRECLSKEGHILKTHGKFHYRWEKADRKPYQWLGFTGGFWFRLLPLWFIKWQVKLCGMFYIHPHDLDENHPKVANHILNWKRHLGLKQSRLKLEKLLKEVKWDEPSSH